MKQLFFVLLMCSTSVTFLFAQDKNSTTTQNSDQEFMIQAAESGMAEVMLGKLGKNQGKSDAVKGYGKMMQKDHTKANTELKSLAAKHNVTLSANLPATMQKTHDDLKKKSAQDFDKAFMEQMIEDHQKAIQLFENEAKNGKDEEIRAWAQKTLPTLKKHHEHAVQISNGLK